MGEHFWPSIYPGVAIGLLYGVSVGGRWNILFGGVGALVASTVAFLAVMRFFEQDGLVPMLVLLAISLAGAWMVTYLAGRLASASQPE